VNKFAAYSGYAVAATLNFVHKRFFKLAFLVLTVKAVSDLNTLVDYTALIGTRYYQFTAWFHNFAMTHGPNITGS
jgi:hypothetical protein